MGFAIHLNPSVRLRQIDDSFLLQAHFQRSQISLRSMVLDRHCDHLDGRLLLG